MATQGKEKVDLIVESKSGSNSGPVTSDKEEEQEESSNLPELNGTDKEKATQLNIRGNQAWKSGKIQDAIKFYSNALQFNPDAADIYRNRSAIHVVAKQFDKALQDAERAIQLENSPKGYCRKAEVHFNMGLQTGDWRHMEDASKSFEMAYQLEDAEEIYQALEQTSYYTTWMRAGEVLSEKVDLLSINPAQK